MKTNHRRAFRAGFSWRHRIPRAEGKRLIRRRERAQVESLLRRGRWDAVYTRERRNDDEGRLGWGMADALGHPRSYGSYRDW